MRVEANGPRRRKCQRRGILGKMLNPSVVERFFCEVWIIADLLEIRSLHSKKIFRNHVVTSFGIFRGSISWRLTRPSSALAPAGASGGPPFPLSPGYEK